MNGDGDLLDAGEALSGGPYNSTCSLTTVADVFGTRGGAQADTEFDTQATCLIDLADFGGGDAFLINVCSYPSQVPGSNPSDCVITPNSGFLTIVKLGPDPADPAEFTFGLLPPHISNDGSTSWTIEGAGSVDLIAFAPDTELDLTETVPDGWQLDGAECLLSDGTATGTFLTDTITDFEIQVGRETTCTFTNSLAKATLTLLKEVETDNGGDAVITDWDLSANGTDVNDLSGKSGVTGDVTAPDTFRLSEANGPVGYTASAWSCVQTGTTTEVPVDADGDVDLEAGDDVTCTITNDDVAPSLTLDKVVVNDNGGTEQESAWIGVGDG